MPRWQRPYGPPGKLRKLRVRTLRTVRTQSCPSNADRLARGQEVQTLRSRTRARSRAAEFLPTRPSVTLRLLKRIFSSGREKVGRRVSCDHHFVAARRYLRNQADFGIAAQCRSWQQSPPRRRWRRCNCAARRIRRDRPAAAHAARRPT